jgi:hypothetical protein
VTGDGIFPLPLARMSWIGRQVDERFGHRTIDGPRNANRHKSESKTAQRFGPRDGALVVTHGGAIEYELSQL